MPGITTSRRIRSGRSLATFSSASGPDSAGTTAYPRGASTASNSLMFLGVSSTTRIFGCRSILPLLARTLAELPHLLRKFLDVDRLDQVAVEPGAEESFAIALHGEGGQSDHRDRGRAWLGHEPAQRCDSVHVGQLDIHQDQIRQVGSGQ